MVSHPAIENPAGSSSQVGYSLPNLSRISFFVNLSQCGRNISLKPSLLSTPNSRIFAIISPVLRVRGNGPVMIRLICFVLSLAASSLICRMPSLWSGSLLRPANRFSRLAEVKPCRIRCMVGMVASCS